MSRPRRIQLDVARHSVLASPPSPAVRAAIKRIGAPSQYRTSPPALAVPVRFTDDLAAALEMSGLRVDVVRPEVSR